MQSQPMGDHNYDLGCKAASLFGACKNALFRLERLWSPRWGQRQARQTRRSPNFPLELPLCHGNQRLRLEIRAAAERTTLFGASFSSGSMRNSVLRGAQIGP